MSAVFGVPVESIPDNASPHEIRAWDSLKHMTLVMALEEEFGISFEDDELPVLTTVEAIVAIVTSHVAE
jgi:acyl carrier protein